ncbi:MAG: hypothetical protein PHY34_02575 [Patescibacteria group bacterium]|nr:hypothetical protein [Patescibacteria group bacterium]MDD5715471.1 hypothetical protein [Patescibacteria group bacterium]
MATPNQQADIQRAREYSTALRADKAKRESRIAARLAATTNKVEGMKQIIEQETAMRVMNEKANADDVIRGAGMMERLDADNAGEGGQAGQAQSKKNEAARREIAEEFDQPGDTDALAESENSAQGQHGDLSSLKNKMPSMPVGDSIQVPRSPGEQTGEGGGDEEQSPPDENQDVVRKDQESATARQMHLKQTKALADKREQAVADEEIAVAEQAEVEAAGEEAQATGKPLKPIPTLPFAMMLALAIMKDGVDFFDWGFLGVVLNLIPIMGITIIVLITGGSLSNFISKKKWLFASGAAVEFIPIIGFMPIWTITIIWMWIEGKRQKPVSGRVAARYTRRIANRGKSALRLLK